MAKVIAKWLAPLMPILVRADQAGFIPGRSTSFGLRRMFGLMSALAAEDPVVAVLLDAAKAFDSVEWPFLFTVLQRLGLGRFFISLVSLLYTDPVARVRVNGRNSRVLPLGQGTRQGCPLSPLLFALAIEPWAESAREFYLQRGVQLHTHKVIISLYADDMVLFIRHPEVNLDPIMSDLRCFGELSGLCINTSKSVIFPLTRGCPTFEITGDSNGICTTLDIWGLRWREKKGWYML